MTTPELIEWARRCNDEFSDCNGCPFKNAEGDCRETLINTLADRTEKLYEDMKTGMESAGCDVCAKKYHPDGGWLSDGCCSKCEFVWRGDTE